MSAPFRFYVFPRDALFAPPGSRLLAALAVLDEELELGLGTGARFFASFQERGDEAAEGRSGEAADFEALESQLADSTRGILEARISLPLPGSDPLAPQGLATERLEVRGFSGLRMVSLLGLGARQVCPACGHTQALDLLDGERPDPRLYCSECGGLTPVQETEIEIPGPAGPLRLRAPCYRFAVRLRARRADGGEQKEPSVVVPEVSFSSRLEAALGCGLRALLVGRPDS